MFSLHCFVLPRCVSTEFCGVISLRVSYKMKLGGKRQVLFWKTKIWGMVWFLPFNSGIGSFQVAYFAWSYQNALLICPQTWSTKKLLFHRAIPATLSDRSYTVPFITLPWLVFFVSKLSPSLWSSSYRKFSILIVQIFDTISFTFGHCFFLSLQPFKISGRAPCRVRRGSARRWEHEVLALHNPLLHAALGRHLWRQCVSCQSALSLLKTFQST